MEGPLLVEVLQFPGTTAAIAGCVSMYVWTWSRGAALDDLSVSYHDIIHRKQYWRILTAALTHHNLIHLLFNMSSLWSCRVAELAFGTLEYLKITFLLLLVPMLLMLAVHHILVVRFRVGYYEYVRAAGYSGVVFGWLTVVAQLTALRSVSIWGFEVPLSLAPFGSLIVTQLIVRQASFVGHASGIVTGYLISFHLFAWFGTYLFLCGVFWTIVGVVFSLKTSSPFSLSFLEWQPHALDSAGIRIPSAPNDLLALEEV